MSLLRYMLNDLRPLVRMLDEPLSTRAPRFAPTTTSAIGSPFSSPFFRDPFATLFDDLPRQPALDVHEDGKTYVVEAELPGVKREDVEVRIAEGGRGLTIEGRVVRRGPAQPQPQIEQAGEGVQRIAGSGADAGTEVAEGADAQVATSQPSQFANYTSTFSQSVSFPRPVNPDGVIAKLENGILSLRIPQAEESGSVKINVE